MLQTVSFKGTVNASSEKTLVSKRINLPFTFKSVRIYFPYGSELKTQYKIFYSTDDSAPSSGEPSGTNIFGTLGQVNYIVGEDGWIEVQDETEVKVSGSYIKVYVNNTDTYTHTIVAVVTIDVKY